MQHYYKLEGKKVIACASLECTMGVRVALAVVGGVKISTVFLGINHNFEDSRVPIVFETMIFNGRHDECCERYATWQDAVAGHKKVKMWIRMEQFMMKELDFDVAVTWMKRLHLI